MRVIKMLYSWYGRFNLLAIYTIAWTTQVRARRSRIYFTSFQIAVGFCVVVQIRDILYCIYVNCAKFVYACTDGRTNVVYLALEVITICDQRSFCSKLYADHLYTDCIYLRISSYSIVPFPCRL